MTTLHISEGSAQPPSDDPGVRQSWVLGVLLTVATGLIWMWVSGVESRQTRMDEELRPMREQMGIMKAQQDAQDRRTEEGIRRIEEAFRRMEMKIDRLSERDHGPTSYGSTRFDK